MKTKRRIATILSLFIVIITGACKGNAYTSRTYEIDDILLNFYALLGGEENLGPAISQLHIVDGIHYQFCENALLAYNPMAEQSQQFYLHQLGNDLLQNGVIPLAIPTENIEVYSVFRSKYNELGGARYLGLPLTLALRDPENGRIVQYFESAGFYQLDTSSVDEVYLLAYGSWKCASFCEYLSVEFASPRITPVPVDEPASRFFDTRFLGSSISEIYKAPDGKLEHVYQNAVIYYDQSLPKGFGLRPLADTLNFQSDPFEAVSSDPGMGFVTIEGENLGFNVPTYFLEFIELNSKMVGKPISRYQKISDNLYRQYFENMVLEYYPNAVDGFQVIPMHQGYNYLKKLEQIENQVMELNPLANVAVINWVNENTLAPGELQTFNALVVDGQVPLPNVEMKLLITLPDGSQNYFDMQPTGPDGTTRFTSEPMNVMSNSTIEYMVCMMDISGDKCGLKDSFLVWSPCEGLCGDSLILEKVLLPLILK